MRRNKVWQSRIMDLGGMWNVRLSRGKRHAPRMPERVVRRLMEASCGYVILSVVLAKRIAVLDTVAMESLIRNQAVRKSTMSFKRRACFAVWYRECQLYVK
jgi:hypothetical protein